MPEFTYVCAKSMPLIGSDPWSVAGSGAIFSQDRTRRYLIWWVWDKSLPLIGVLGINPSSADGRDHDQTTRKLVGFGERLGWGGFLLGNPFSLISTDQRGLLGAEDPVGTENDRHLGYLFASTAYVVAAWGTAKTGAVRRLLDQRLKQMEPMLAGKSLRCLGRAVDGSPRHPLMLRYSTPLEPWNTPC